MTIQLKISRKDAKIPFFYLKGLNYTSPSKNTVLCWLDYQFIFNINTKYNIIIEFARIGLFLATKVYKIAYQHYDYHRSFKKI